MKSIHGLSPQPPVIPLQSTSSQSLNPLPTALPKETLTFYQTINANMRSAEFIANASGTHFDNSKALIQECAQGLSGEALIVGYGNGQDIPLAELAQQFDRVTLLDIDLIAVCQAVKNLSPDLRKKIVVKQGDLTGVVASLSRQALELAKTIKDEAKFRQAIVQLFENTHPVGYTEFNTPCASFVVSSLVLSQLPSELCIWISHLYATAYHIPNTQLFSDHSFQLASTAFTVKVFKSHLENLHHWVDKEGRIYFADTVAETYLYAQNIQPNGMYEISKSPLMVMTPKLLELLEETKLDKSLKNEFWNWEKHPPKVSRKENQWIMEQPGSLMSVMAFFLKAV